MEHSQHQEASQGRGEGTASAQLPRVLRDADERARRVADRKEEARRRVQAVGRQASDSWQRAGDAARAYTRENPAAATLAAFGVGMVAGCLLAQRRAPSPRWRSAVPAVAAADRKSVV